jgi:hypothetical protein
MKDSKSQIGTESRQWLETKRGPQPFQHDIEDKFFY